MDLGLGIFRSSNIQCRKYGCPFKAVPPTSGLTKVDRKHSGACIAGIVFFAVRIAAQHPIKVGVSTGSGGAVAALVDPYLRIRATALIPSEAALRYDAHCKAEQHEDAAEKGLHLGSSEMRGLAACG